VIAITEQASQALATMNDILSRQGTLANVSLDQAKDLLTNLGALAGAQAEVLQKRIEDLTAAAERAKEVADQMADQAASIQDQIDELNGDDTSIEDRRHQKALDDLKGGDGEQPTQHGGVQALGRPGEPTTRFEAEAPRRAAGSERRRRR
jgi:hypothetical protein